MGAFAEVGLMVNMFDARGHVPVEVWSRRGGLETDPGEPTVYSVQTIFEPRRLQEITEKRAKH